MASMQSVGDKKNNVADWFYKPIWQKKRTPDHGSIQAPEGSFPWLVFCDTLGLGERIASHLAAGTGPCILVRAGKEFRQPGGREFIIRPTQLDDYIALWRALHELECLPTKIIHLWSVTWDDEQETGPAFFARMQNLGLYSLIHFAQAVGRQSRIEPLELIAVSNGVHAITGAEGLSPEKSTLLGICKSIPQELGMIRCRAIDLEMSSRRANLAETLAGHLWAEVVRPSADQIVAYRENERYVQTYVPVRLERPSVSPLRRRGTYLITGGLGGIGLVLAEHLARTAQARLVLTSRAAFPDRNEWSEWMARHADSDRISIRIRRLQAIEGLGAEVLVRQADIADPMQMKQTIEVVQARFGEIQGVIHAAGLSDKATFGMIQTVEPRHCEMHFRPKVHGLYVLEEVLREQPLDFCVLFSSLSTVLAGLGMVAYTAANSFMDAFSDKHNRAAKNRWICVDWDKWQLSRPEEQHASFGKSIEGFAITPMEGTTALECILAHRADSRIVVSTGDLNSRIRQWIELNGLDS